MRLLFAISLYAPEVIGGAELTLARIADALVARNHDVAVLTTGARSADTRLPSGVLVMRRRIANFFPLMPRRAHSRLARLGWHLIDTFNPGGYLQMRAALRRFKPDVVVTDTLAGLSVAVWPAVRQQGVPLVQRLCDTYLLSPSLNLLFAPPGSRGALFRRLLRWPHRRLAHNVSAVVSLSAAVLDLHREAGMFAQTPAECIPTAFSPVSGRPAASDQKLRFGFIGLLAPTKGIEVLLEGFLAADPDATLDIAGAGEASYVAELKRRFPDPRLRFLGWVSDKGPFFDNIDLCLVPSRIYDTLPTVIIEAFAHHVPVMASPIGGIPEMIDPGRNGQLVALGTATEVAAFVTRAVADRAAIRAMSETTAAASARYLDPARQIDRWEALLARAAGATSPVDARGGSGARLAQ